MSCFVPRGVPPRRTGRPGIQSPNPTPVRAGGGSLQLGRASHLPGLWRARERNRTADLRITRSVAIVCTRPQLSRIESIWLVTRLVGARSWSGCGQSRTPRDGVVGQACSASLAGRPLVEPGAHVASSAGPQQPTSRPTKPASALCAQRASISPFAACCSDLSQHLLELHATS